MNFLLKLKFIMQKYPIEILYIALYSCIFLFFDNTFISSNFEYFLFMPIFLSIIYIFRGNRTFYKFLFFLPIVGNLAIYKLHDKFNFYEEPRYWALVLIVLITLVFHPFKKDPQDLAVMALKRVVSIMLALCSMLLVYLAIIILLRGIESLFDMSFYIGYELNLFLFSFFGICPIVFLFFENRDENLVGIFTKTIFYIVSISFISYAILLHCYVVYIAFNAYLPRGIISFIVLPYVIGIAIVSMFCALFDKFETFYKYFPLFCIAPLSLLIIGIGVRVLEYGITQSRFYLIIVSIFAIGLFLLALFRTQKRFYAFFAIGLIFVSTFILDVKQIVINSQLQILNNRLVELNLLDKNGEILKNFSEIYKKSVKKDEMENLIRHVESLENLQGFDKNLTLIYGVGYDEIKKYKFLSNIVYRYLLFKLKQNRFSLDGFKELVVLQSNLDNSVIYKQDGKEIVLFNAKEFMQRYFKDNDFDRVIQELEAGNSEFSDSFLVFKSEYGILFFENVEIECDKNKKICEYYNLSDKAYFLKR